MLGGSPRVKRNTIDTKMDKMTAEMIGINDQGENMRDIEKEDDSEC